MVRTFAMMLTATILLSGAASVATAPSDQTSQDAAALLTEVRLLRQAIENLAGNGARVQIVFGRLQLQEQRTAVAARRLEDARNALAGHTARVEGLSGQLKDLEARTGDSTRTVEREAELRETIANFTRELKQLDTERGRLALLESEAASALADEQSRWADLNRQLEEIERALAPRRQ